ncbi:MAG: hypothetical protein COU32_00070 [Candidatus Magasanikbacteria bacterium CG10_big_fil_rev_8_21_14_0_10_42_10]|uniref:Uncharacterized protein n=2 Tax=Candidatus Magasanikiibacteriota TaxID=1752731 RepID=A0A2H0TXA0_9BACT|nr:MAG: hypothetical protein COU32_00070 [Candidatus Magasanikbacteria bacterium CG10_big_fil_rev_8_21_14_0_10_42_10]PIZ93116.1 MAG: hypothetical protein COX82_03350 [Candidatus Magasanikbacteria bacterium CG_4_10_14_0_2_um_filter_41_10]
MFGFGSKKKKKEKPSNLGVQIHTIPDIFYGGNDPVIYHTESHEGKRSESHNGIQKKKLVASTRQSSSSGSTWISSHKRLLVWIGAGLILVAVTAFASWYYVQQAKQQVTPTQIVSSKKDTNFSTISTAVTTPINTELIQPVTTPSSTTSTLDETQQDIAKIQAIDPVSFPRILLASSQDTDADQLTDEEEVIFKTNPDVWDTDKDGYYDGQEILNLFNPSGFAPVKLIDSGLVNEYVSPIWQYRVYYPVSWQIGTVDTEGRQVLVSTISGDYVEIRIFDRMIGQSFQDWFALNIAGEKFQDIQQIINRFKETAFLRRDGLVGYFLSPKTVTVFIYHPGITGAVSYRSVMRMMIESFRQTSNVVDLPAQQALPTPPGVDNENAPPSSNNVTSGPSTTSSLQTTS